MLIQSLELELLSVAMGKAQENYKNVDCDVNGLLNQLQQTFLSKAIIIKNLKVFYVCHSISFFILTATLILNVTVLKANKQTNQKTLKDRKGKQLLKSVEVF